MTIALTTIAICGVGALLLLAVAALVEWGPTWTYLAHRFAPCPACTYRGKVTKFRADLIYQGNTHGALVHNCTACGAIWISEPEVPWAQWQVRLPAKAKAFDEQGVVERAVSAFSPRAGRE